MSPCCEHPDGEAACPNHAPRPATWQVTDNIDALVREAHRSGTKVPPPTYTIMRGSEVGATCSDYGLACVIEATLNLRDGTVE